MKQIIDKNEKPILFNSEMVRAVLDGKKTQTRRVIKEQPKPHHWGKIPSYELKAHFMPRCKTRNTMAAGVRFSHNIKENPNSDFDCWPMCPYGCLGDRLWVRETFQYDNKDYVQTYKDEPWRGMPSQDTAQVHYREYEDSIGTEHVFHWKPSIFMPRWASRMAWRATIVLPAPSGP